MAYRVLIAQFMHETNTFSKLPTTLDDYRKRWLIEGEAMVPRFTGTKNEIGGYIDAAKKYGWQPVWAGAANATPSGKLTRETWETIRDMIVDAARKAGKLDGICLSLHGAMVTETEDDAEGALLEALRGVVGPDVPIAATLDLHANATVRMARNANALVSYRTYPHIDGYERAVQAAALVQAAMDGKKKPRCLLVQPAMLEGAEHGRTTQPGLMLDLLAKADSFEKEPGIDVVSIQAGFTWADIPYTGPSVAVSHEPGGRGARQGDRGRADRRDLAAARGGGEVLLSADRRRHRRGESRRRQEGPAGHRRRHRQSGRRRLQRHHAGAAGADRCRHRERGLRHDLRSGHGAAGDQGGCRRGDRGQPRRPHRSGDGRAGQGQGDRQDAVGRQLQERRADERRRRDLDGADGGAAHRRHRRGDDLQPHPDHRPAGLPEPGHRSHGQERAGGEERAALPRRLRADRARDRAGRFRRHLLARHRATEVHQAAPADLAVRRHQRTLRRP